MGEIIYSYLETASGTASVSEIPRKNPPSAGCSTFTSVDASRSLLHTYWIRAGVKNQKRICIGREEGRFSNSKAVPSFLVSLLSSPPPPPSHPICRATCAILHPRVSSRVSYIVVFFFSSSQVVRKIMPRGERGPENRIAEAAGRATRRACTQPQQPGVSPGFFETASSPNAQRPGLEEKDASYERS